MSVCDAGNPSLVEHLLLAGANTKAVRQDGACAFSILVSRNDAEIISLVFKYYRLPMLAGADTNEYLQHLANAFSSFNFSNTESWLLLGASTLVLEGEVVMPLSSTLGLEGEVTMLLSSPAIEECVKDRLIKLRAFLHHHNSILYLKETPLDLQVDMSYVDRNQDARLDRLPVQVLCHFLLSSWCRR